MTRTPLLAAVALAFVVGCGSATPVDDAVPVATEPSPYRERYRHLPNLHDPNRTIAGSRKIQIDRGYFEGPLRLRGPGYQKRGAGVGDTVVDGDLELRGDGWILSKLTITGDVRIWGSDNSLLGCEILGTIDVYEGSGNRLPNAGR